MKKFKEIVAAGLMVALLAGVTQASIVGASTTLKVVETPAVSVYTSQGQTDTTLVVTPVPVDLDGNVLTMSNFGSSPTVTVDPGVSGYEEIESFTGITNNGNQTATLSGMTRDLQSVYPYTSTNTGKQHGGGAVVVFSNNPQLYGRLAAPENDNVWTGLQTYSTGNQPVYNGNPSFTNPLALIDKAYADALSIVGAPTSTENGMGVVRLATQAQVGTGVASSTSGAPLVIENKFASSTYNGSTVFQGEIPALRSTKDIDPNFIATSSANTYNFGGTVNIASSTIGTSTQATTTITGVLIYKGSTLGTPKFGGTGTDGALSASSGTTLINVGSANFYEKDYTSISLTGTAALSFTSNATSSSGVTVVLRSQGACTLTSSATVINLKYLGGGLGIGFNPYAGLGGSGGGGGGSTGGQGSVGGSITTGGATPVFSAIGGNGGVQLPALASSTNLALPGGNGAAGASGTGAGGNAGLGGGGLYIECAGAYNFTTGTIDASGSSGSNGAQSNGSGTGGGGGGGGGGGNIFVRYGSLTADTGTYTTSAGGGGSGGAANSATAGQAGGGGGAGSHLEVINTTNY